MVALAIDVLADFDLDFREVDEVIRFEIDAANDVPFDVDPLGPSPALETARKIEEACALVRAEMRAEADDRMCRALDEQAARFALERNAARRAWTEQEAAPLAQALGAAFADLKARLAEATAAALRPFLTEEARTAALDDLGAQIDKLLADPAHPTLAISGPADLLARLKARLGAETGAVTFRPDDARDVRVVADATILETRIQAWADRLARAGE